MGLRFRQSFRIMPGVRVNLSRSGLSTSIGVPGATLNLGRRSAVTLGLPGTGLSYRQSLRGPGAPSPTAEPSAPDVNVPTWTPPPPPPSLAPPAAQGDSRRIGSGDVVAMTSQGLQTLKALIVDAGAQRDEAERDTVAAKTRLAAHRRELRWKGHALLRWAFRRRAEALEAKHIPEAEADLADLSAWIEASEVDTVFDVPPAVAGTFSALCAAFERLSTAKVIWDVTSEADVNRKVARSTASRALERTPVHFDFAQHPVMLADRPVPRLANANGADIYLFPLLAFLPAGGYAFALVDLLEAGFQFSEQSFMEEEGVPPDAVIAGQTWLKANKDGSPDRRFAENRQIPICRYGKLTLRSASGLNEEYMISDAAALQGFSAAFGDHLAAIKAAIREAA